METEILSETATHYARWEAGELSARDAATAIAQELIAEIEPAEHALEQCKKARREELGTLLIRVGEPLEVLGRVTGLCSADAAQRDRGAPGVAGRGKRGRSVSGQSSGRSA